LSEQQTGGWRRGAASHAAVAAISAVVVLALARWLAGPDSPSGAHPEPNAEQAPPDATPGVDQRPQQASEQADDVAPPAGEDDAAAAPVALPEPATAHAPPLGILTEPAALRVWHNTAMTLRTQPAESERDRFVRFVWHFEDGSRPLEGEVVDHVFPESVADRHVTVEGIRRDGSRLVVSKRLPIERLPVVPIDGEDAPAPGLPKARGPRVLWLAGLGSQEAEVLFARLAEARLTAIVVAADAETTATLLPVAAERLPDVPVLRLAPDVAASPEAPAPTGPAFEIVRAATGAVAEIPDTAAVVVGRLALVFVDTRPLVLEESALVGAHRGLERASAWPATLLVSTRPLSALLDDETVADRAYRLYEYALRDGARAIVSTSSAVAYDARYGGLQAVAVGRVRPPACARLRGSDACQPGTATVLEIRDRGAIRAYHLIAPTFERWLQGDALPSTVGRYRR
jgi:hypothetical protein